MVRLLILACILTITACQKEHSVTRKYFAIDSLIKSQKEFMFLNKATLEKRASLSGHESTVTFTPDTAAWTREFEIFSSLSVMNKPVNHGIYDVKEITENGLRRKEFCVKNSVLNNESLQVHDLTLTYKSSHLSLQQLDATISESNEMYEGLRHLSMEFEEVNGKMLLISYSIQGGQKMFLADSVKYSVNGRITYPQ